MKIYNSITELVGNTPLVDVSRFAKSEGVNARILVKLEAFNPTSSAKDRIAKQMIENAEKEGKLKTGGVIIEPTSGNTGIGLSAIATAKGYRCIIVMPDTMSLERRKLMSAYGAELVLTDGKLGMKGAIAKASELAGEIPNSFIPNQFENSANPDAHFNTTGPEIWRDTEGKLDYFVATVGTGGTFSGTARYLKQKMNSKAKMIAVEPESSPLMSKGRAGAHKIQGIGANFVPKTMDTSIYDEILTATDDEAYDYAKRLVRTEGIFVGISSGAALAVATRIAKREESAGKTIVVVLADSGERYLSTPDFV
ncbi:MAG: cysteine synthase A [Clostridia bacterium]|nr:cysteine synthase A [Clostridia bacterium]